MNFEGYFAENRIRYHFHYTDTYKYMMPYIAQADDEEYDILAPKEYIESQRPFYPENQDDAYVEYKSLIGLTSLALLPRKCCLFHAVALKWNGYAWLLTGSSGAGKTTQYKKWKISNRDDVEMICGDMPLIALKDDGSIWVHPSPWNGKERIKGKTSAPLGGVVLLEKDDSNSIELLTNEESAMPLFLQWAVRPETEEQIIQLAEIENRLLDRYPVWRLNNKGDFESAKLTADTFQRYLDTEHLV